MRQLTVAQSYSLPYIANGQNTVLVSPSLSGKTLSYLLPVLSHIGSHSKAINSIKVSSNIHYFVPHAFYAQYDLQIHVHARRCPLTQKLHTFLCGLVNSLLQI